MCEKSWLQYRLSSTIVVEWKSLISHKAKEKHLNVYSLRKVASLVLCYDRFFLSLHPIFPICWKSVKGSQVVDPFLRRSHFEGDRKQWNNKTQVRFKQKTHLSNKTGKKIQKWRIKEEEPKTKKKKFKYSIWAAHSRFELKNSSVLESVGVAHFYCSLFSSPRT